MDESGAEVFNVLLPSGTPLPARRNHTLTGQGQLSSLCLELYQRTADQPEKLAKVHTHTHTEDLVKVQPHACENSKFLLTSKGETLEVRILGGGSFKTQENPILDKPNQNHVHGSGPNRV